MHACACFFLMLFVAVCMHNLCACTVYTSLMRAKLPLQVFLVVPTLCQLLLHVLRNGSLNIVALQVICVNSNKEHIQTNLNTSLFSHKCAYMYVCKYVCMYVCMYILCMYVYIMYINKVSKPAMCIMYYVYIPITVPVYSYFPTK